MQNNFDNNVMKINKPTTQYQGLSDTTVKNRLLKEGFNELKSVGHKGWSELFFAVASEPIILLILICSWLYLILGDRQEALALLCSILLVIGIEVFQSLKAERAIEALRDLSSPRALVIRNGTAIRIAGREVVRGDLVLLAEGDRVPADGVLIDGVNLTIDEAILTGESMSVAKQIDQEALAMASPGGANTPFLYASSLVVSGHGLMKVMAIGMQTEIGRIGESLNEIKSPKTKLQLEINALVKILGAIGGVMCLVVFVAYGYSTKDWLDGLLYGLSLAMSILPQEFPVILTIFMALGAWRMSHHKVLARQQRAIQALGGATRLCVDKTGTLTMNQLALVAIYDGANLHQINANNKLTADLEEILRYSALACGPDSLDPLEKAIAKLAQQSLKGKQANLKDYHLVQEYSLTSEQLSVTYLWRYRQEAARIVASKGAPEAIFKLCDLSESEHRTWMKAVDAMAVKGLRVLAVAEARHQVSHIPKHQASFNLKLLGLIGFIDPIRPGVKEAVKECHRAGIKLTMITGDYPETALQIGKQIGLDVQHGALTGEMIRSLSLKELKHRIARVSIIARVAPDQKLKIVEAYKAMGEIVVMTGDGVNDAPALKSAHVGVAMGSRGTDVAREAAGIVLLDDNFNSIVRGVRQGRRIFDNIRKAMMYVLSIHLVTGSFTLMSVVFQWPLVLLPLHLVFLELIVDPTSSIAFEAEAEEDDIMSRRPRPVAEKIFNQQSIRLAILQGLWLLFIIVVIYKFYLNSGAELSLIRSMVLSALIFGNLGLIISNRSASRPFWTRMASPNRALSLVLIGALVLLVIVIYSPLQIFFKLEALSWKQVLVSASTGLAVIVWSEIWKVLIKRLDRQK